MTHAEMNVRGGVSRGGSRPRLAALGIASASLLAACTELGEIDSWLFDQSVVGRWEYTPTIVPILERIDVIERDEGDSIEITHVTPEDLIPVVEEYQLGPGDEVKISILDFMQQGAVSEFDLQVDLTGALDIAQLGRVVVQGMSSDEARKAIASEVVAKGISIEEPVISIQLLKLRQATFSVFGAIQGVGRYSIPAPDYRLLDALTEAGGITPVQRRVQIIRQVILSDELKKGAGAAKPASATEKAAKKKKDDQAGSVDLNSLIDDITRDAERPAESAKPSAEPPAPDSSKKPGAGRGDAPPPVDLVEGEPEQQKPSPAAPKPGGSWMFLNGEWVQVTGARKAAGDSGKDKAGGAPEKPEGSLVTQRVIEIPVGPLLKGLAQYNLVIRPGDVISIPGADVGLVYMSGPGIGRPGVYELPNNGRLTLKQAVAAAGGLSQIGIPERVDLIRRVGDDREATIRLNLRAVYEGTQPDMFLKPDDQVNFGTNFFAAPLAIIRSGFRMTYGFGFLADRNFGNDIFGPEPTNVFGR